MSTLERRKLAVFFFFKFIFFDVGLDGEKVMPFFCFLGDGTNGM